MNTLVVSDISVYMGECNVNVCVCTCVCVCACVHACMRECVCVCVCMCAFTYIYIYMHVHVSLLHMTHTYSCTVAALQTTPLSLHRFCADCPPTHSPHHMCKSPRSQSSGQRALSVHWRECLDHRRSQLQEGWGNMSGGRKRIHYTHMDINEWDSPTAIETMEHA